MSTVSCGDGVNEVTTGGYLHPGPPLTTVHLVQQSDVIASQKASSDAAAPPKASPAAGSCFGPNASLAITVEYDIGTDTIQGKQRQNPILLDQSLTIHIVVPQSLTRPELRELTSYTKDPTEILRFEAGQLVFRTRLAVALAHNMASRVPSTQHDLQKQIDAINQSINQTFKLVNDLSLKINGDFSIPPAYVH